MCSPSLSSTQALHRPILRLSNRVSQSDLWHLGLPMGNGKGVDILAQHFEIHARCQMDCKRKSVVVKGKKRLTAPPTRKSPRLAGLPPSLSPSSPKFVLGPSKLLVLALAANAMRIHSKARENPQILIHSKAQESPQAPVVEKPKDMKGKRTARISVKPIQRRFSQRIIA
ncbi:hypothetical protein PIB30_082380 [Stylosanthes scabra]|uniref:Uncharacterized protein n=1 Tax=Stylosanthes scabra TaxID=79078 RepID=A0ABU6RS93_9FABA|nr:hypothetical protein [Stylosanthes scabra]